MEALGIGLLVVSVCFAVRYLMEWAGRSQILEVKILWMTCWFIISFYVGLAIQYGLKYLPIALKLVNALDKAERLLNIFK